MGEFSIGVDIVSIDKIKTILTSKIGKRFKHRIFTDSEIKFCTKKTNSYQHFAGRFAAKEAVMKAFGTGRIGISWTDIEVVRAEAKAPEIKLHGRGKVFAETKDIEDISISISHSKKYAIAFAVILF